MAKKDQCKPHKMINCIMCHYTPKKRADKKHPPKLRAELAADPFYRTCCIADADCSGRIEWHHNLIYAGQRINAKFCILPACAWHHARARLKAIKDRLDRVMLSRATVEDLAQFPRFDWVQRKRYLGLV